MWIGEFSKAAGVSVGTTRLYVRLGLLRPTAGPTGGSRPYLTFSGRDLRLLAAIQAGQAFGMSLAEIKSLVDERRGGGGHARMRSKLLAHRVLLEQRVVELKALISFVDAKIRWLDGGRVGPMPMSRGS